MTTQQGDVALLDSPIAQELLHSNHPAHLGYIWKDGTPRVVPIWLQWNGKEIVFTSAPKAPKVTVLSENPKVAVTIDSLTWPYHVLYIRGIARVEMVNGVAPEFAAAAKRCLGEEQGKAFVEQTAGLVSHMARICVRPEWVGMLDFETRFPSALEAAMTGV
jgi:hypothetical protein